MTAPYCAEGFLAGRIIFALFVYITICAGLFFFDSSDGFAASNHINAATGFKLGHPVMKRVLLPWAEEVRRLSGGLIEIRFFNPGALAPEHEHFNALKQGELGLAHAAVGISRDQLPISGLMDMPSPMNDCLSASEAFWRLYESIPEMRAEFRGIKVLAVHAMPPCQINLNKRNISSLSDLKYQKILTTPDGDSASLLRALAMSPLIAPIQDFAGSLSRGMADGCLLPMHILRQGNMQANIQSIILCNLRMDGYWLGMSMDAYNALPAEARNALNELSGLELSLAIARALNELNNLSLAELSKENIRVNELGPEERDGWLARITPQLRESWIAQLQGRQPGDADEIWNRSQGIFLEANAKWGHRAKQQITPSR